MSKGSKPRPIPNYQGYLNNWDEIQWESKIEPCPNCGERKVECACVRNLCFSCGKPVGNIVFTICDECWNKKTNLNE